MRGLTIKKSAVMESAIPLVFYLVGCVAAVLIFPLGHVWMPLLFSVGALALLLAWRRIQWSDGWQRYLSFGAALLSIGILSRAFAIADYFLVGMQYDEWPFSTHSPEAALFKGEFIAVVGLLLTVFSWRLCGGLRVSPAVVLQRSPHIHRVMIVIYLGSLVGMLVVVLLGKTAGALGQLLPTILALGLVVSFLLPFGGLQARAPRLIAVALMSLPFVILASGSGMKENIILSMLPTVAMAWVCINHPLVRSGMVVIGLILLAIISSYVGFYRQEVWGRISQGLSPSETITQDFIRKIEVVGIAETTGDGLRDFVARLDASYRQGWAVAIADEQELQPGLVFEPLTYVFVPRILWPSKPSALQGAEYTSLVTGQRFVEGGSSTAVGFYTGLYLGYGWLAFVIGALFAGALLAGMTRIAKRLGGALAAGLYIFSMLPFMLRMSESWPIDVFAKPIIGLVYVLVIVAFARVGSQVAFGVRTT